MLSRVPEPKTRLLDFDIALTRADDRRWPITHDAQYIGVTGNVNTRSIVLSLVGWLPASPQLALAPRGRVQHHRPSLTSPVWVADSSRIRS